jgi:hypothetical protein
MATYKVTSDNFTLAPKGASVSDADLQDLNIDALISGGHIQEQGKLPTPKTESKE